MADVHDQSLVPWPQRVDLLDGQAFEADAARVCATHPELEDAASWLRDALADADLPPAGETGGRIVLSLGAAPPEVPAPVGIDPALEAHDERYSIRLQAGLATVTAASARGALRAAATLAQLAEDTNGRLPQGEITDGPRFAWRGLMLDVVRHPFTSADIAGVLRLLARYKLNVLHLHLTDSEGWRAPCATRPELTDPARGGTRNALSGEDLDRLVEQAGRLGITLVAEVDLPGHSTAALRASPELVPAGRDASIGYLDPTVPGVTEFLREVVAEATELAPGRFLHVGGDEPFAMPDEAYTRAVREAIGAAHTAGRAVVAWQEAVRADALGPQDVVQQWIGSENVIDADTKKAELPPEHHHFVDEMVALFARAPGDVPAAVAAGLPLLVSSNDTLYLDRPYAEPAADEEGELRRARLGFREYPAKTLQAMYEWTPEQLLGHPGASIVGIEAAMWSETIETFDDLAFLLLPRLAGVAEHAWCRRPPAWPEHLERLARHRDQWSRTGWDAAFWPASDAPRSRRAQERPHGESGR